MTCQERRDLFLLYVAGALDPAETAELRAHLLTGCPACAASLTEAESLLHQIPQSLTPVAPPTAAWSKISSRLARSNAASANPQHKFTPAWMGWAVAALILISMGLLLRNANEQLHSAELRENGDLSIAKLAQARADSAERELDTTKTALLAAQNQEKSMATRLTTLEQKVKDLSTDNTKMLAQLQTSHQDMMGAMHHMLNADRYAIAPADMKNVRGAVYVDHAEGMVILAADNLQKLAPGKTYELWIIPEGGTPIAAGTFDATPKGVAMHETKMPPMKGKMVTVAVTAEPMGGMPTPTMPVLFAANIK